MAYLSPIALKNLKTYAYRAVDECVYPSSYHPLHILTILQVSCIPIRPWSLLELVYHSLAADSCAKHSTLLNYCFSDGGIDIHPR